jgi:hypothetical protein
MKIPVFILALLVAILFSPSLISQNPIESNGKHLGTWKLVSTKYGAATSFTDYPKKSFRLKIINATHFTWVEVDASTKRVLASAGGRYKRSGDSYTETIEFAGEGMETYLGKSQKFTVRVEGDKLFQSGELSDGLKIEENWERVK